MNKSSLLWHESWDDPLKSPVILEHKMFVKLWILGSYHSKKLVDYEHYVNK